MVKTLGYLFLALVATAMVIVSIPKPAAEYPRTLSGGRKYLSTDTQVGKVDIEINGQKVWLNIYLDRPMSCREAIEELEINSFSVDGRSYFPVCQVINDRYLKVMYEEVTSI